MLDFNEAARPHSLINDQLNVLIDAVLVTERKSQSERKYLGASRLGHLCSRALQYEYTAAGIGESSSFSGQTLRIFAAGHLFEELAAGWLRLAGFELLTEDTNGEQFGFKALEGRIAGHIDGIIQAAPSELGMSFPALWEAKSMNSRSWKETVKKGLVLSKPIYAAQIALYQAYLEPAFTGISQNPCLFTAINKDTSEVYHELIPFDGALAQRMSDKAVNIIRATEAGELLPRSFSSREWFECKICHYHKKCWGEL